MSRNIERPGRVLTWKLELCLDATRASSADCLLKIRAEHASHPISIEVSLTDTVLKCCSRVLLKNVHHPAQVPLLEFRTSCLTLLGTDLPLLHLPLLAGLDVGLGPSQSPTLLLSPLHPNTLRTSQSRECYVFPKLSLAGETAKVRSLHGWETAGIYPSGKGSSFTLSLYASIPGT